MKHVLHLRFVAIVVEEDRVDVAVAGVEDVVDLQSVLACRSLRCASAPRASMLRGTQASCVQ